LIVSLEDDRNKYNLELGNSWGYDDSLVITVDHDHRSNTTGAVTPTGLPYELLLTLLVFKPDLEHLGKVLAQLVTGSSLYASSIDRDIEFNSGRVISSCEFFFFRFPALDNWDCKHLLIAGGIVI